MSLLLIDLSGGVAKGDGLPQGPYSPYNCINCLT